jgi:preprotein translocase subunit SecG
MATVILVIHLMLAVTLVGVVLLQRSEGGALGMGGGGAGAGGFLTGRGTANMLTRVTAGLAAGFFVTSMLLTILAQQTGPGVSSGYVSPAAKKTEGAPAAPTETPKSGGILESLQKPEPAVPQSK